MLLPLLVSWRDWPERRNWYCEHFIPELRLRGVSVGRDTAERELIYAARKGLVRDEWSDLPGLIEELEAMYRELLVTYWERSDLEWQAGSLVSAPSREDARQRQRALLGADGAAGPWWGLAGGPSPVGPSPEGAARQAPRRRVELGPQRAREHQLLLAGLERVVRERFLTAREWLLEHDNEGLITDDEFHHVAHSYVTQWCTENLLGPEGKPFVPDLEQATAIATVQHHALVGARAGSGKTATMVARAVFLVKACGVDPASILMLAFNVSAAEQLRARLEKLMPGGRVPHVMTFHALAHRLVHPRENLLFDHSDSMRPLSEHVRDVIDDFLRDPQSQARLREVMLTYFRNDWSRVIGRGDDLAPSDQIEYRRHLQDESIKGDFVKSYGEKVIANILFANGFAGDGRSAESYYGYEHDVRWNGTNYRPDFSIYDQNKKRRIVIEYFGMEATPDYDRLSDDKREFWRQRDEAFLEYFPTDVARPDFERRVLADLQRAGAPLRKLSDEELWQRIKKRAVDRFTEATTTLMQRARQRRWDGEGLRREWETVGLQDHHLDDFIDLAATILDAYARSLTVHGKEDFSGLMWRAIAEIGNGTTTFGQRGRVDGDLRALRHIVVDEFQDFSLMFFELLRAVLDVSPDARVMAVGDDWQAINEFAGSTTEYFEQFDQVFRDATRLSLTTNRRSAPLLVALGNAVMAGRGRPAAAARSDQGVVREFTADTFEPSPLEAQTFGNYDRTTPMILRLVQAHRMAGRNVAVLSRRRRGWWEVNVNGEAKAFRDFGTYGAYLRELLGVEDPNEVRFSSTHGFKGEESDAIIMLEVTERSYPLLHPTWALFQVFGDTLHTLTEAERRLFYVGISRPHLYLDVVTSEGDPSPFWSTTRGGFGLAPLDWDWLSEVRLGPAADLVEVRVFNSGVKDFKVSVGQLKADGFRFRGGTSQYWWRLMPSTQFDDVALLRAAWAQHPGIRVEVWGAGRCMLSHAQPGGQQSWSPPF